MIAPLLAILAAAALVGAYVTDSRTLAGVGFALAVVGGVMALAVWLLEPASGGTQSDDEQSDDEPAVEEPVVEEPAVEEPVVEEPVVEEPEVDEPAVEDPVVEEDPEPDEPVLPVEPAPVEDPAPSPATVWVITGRKRYHLRECPLLGQRPAEELSIDTARQRGFSPCSACAR